MTATNENRCVPEDDFRLDYNRKTIPIYRWGLVLAIVIFMFFYILDVYVIPDSLFASAVIRFAVVPVSLGALVAFSFRKGYERHHQPALAAASLITNGLLLAIIVFSASPDRYLYFAALALVMLFSAYILRPRALWQAGISSITTAATLAVLLTAEYSFVIKLSMTLYFVAVYIVGIAGCRLTEQFYWNDFLLNRDVAKARDRAEEATRLKDKYISLVSHDLKGPISAIRGFMHLAQNPSSSPDEMREFAMHACKSADGLLKTVDTLLSIDRLQSETIRPEVRPFDVSALGSETFLKLQYLADAKAIVLRNEIPLGTVFAGDRVLIGQVLLNLVGNAIKFTPSGGSVTLFLHERLTIAVRDTGIGIPPHILPHLFRHELRTSGVGTAGETGTGLGLPLCFDIVKAHNGSLRVETGPTGTTLFIQLPPT